MKTRAHLALAIVLGYFALAIVANAIDRAATIGWRELALLTEAQQRDLSLAWRLSMGELGIERGPLFTASMFVGTLGAPADLPRIMLARHLIFPLASIVVVASIVRARVPSVWLRVVVLAGGGLAALHLSDETLAPLCGLAACFVFASEPCERPRADLRRGALAGLSWTVGVLLAPEMFVPAVASVLALGLGASASIGSRAWVRAAGACAILAAAGLSLVLAGFRAALVPQLAGAPVAGAAIGFLVFGALAIALVVRNEERPRHAPMAAAAWIGALPIAAAGLSRGDPMSVHLGLVAPSIALLVLAGRCAPGAPLSSGAAALLVATFLLGSAPQYDRTTVWRPTVFRDLLDVARGRRGPQPEDDDLFAAAMRMRAMRGCAVVTSDLIAAQLVSGVAGPIDGDAPGELEGARCPQAVQSIRSFDRPYRLAALAFGSDLRERAESYAITEQIGPATFVARSRERVRASERDLAARVSASDGSVTVLFDRSVPAEHVVVLRARVNAERVTAEVMAGDARVREPMEIPVQNGALWIPIEAERAEWSWIAGRSAIDALAADRVRLHVDPPSSIVVEEALELAPPRARATGSRRCARTIDLLGRRGYARRTRAPVEDDRVLLDPNPPGMPPAELFLPITPCPGACLVGEVGLDGEISEGFSFEVHVIDGPERPLLLDWQIAPGWRRPFEIPLERWAGRDVMLRFATAPGDRAEGDYVRIHRPRVRPCASLVSVVHALHDGRHRVVRGEPSVSGDVLSLPVAALGQPPAEVRVPITVPEGACLAVDLTAVDHDGAVVAVAGVVHDARVHRLAREVIVPGDAAPVRSHGDLSLAPWEGRDVELYFAGWPLERGRSGRAQFVRPRVHRCGERADWAF